MLASLSGRLVYALASIVSLPWLARLLGAEAVGLVGFFNTIVMVMMVFEGGLTSSLIQKLASNKAKESVSSERYKIFSGSMALTYFVFFVFLGTIIATVISVSSKNLVDGWLHIGSIPESEVVDSLICIGLFVGMALPVMALQGVLIGRECQLKLNMIYIPYSLARTLGVLLVISFFSKDQDVKFYFMLQVGIQFLYLVGLLIASFAEFSEVYKRMAVKVSYLKKGISFSRGVLFISLTTVFVVQFDKVYLSGHTALVEYAAYTLASTIAGIPYIFSSALNSVLFPRFSISLNTLDEAALFKIFRASGIGVVLLMGVLCPAIYFYAGDVLGSLFDASLARRINEVLPILVAGTAMQCLLIVPFALQMAAKWTSMSLRLNCIWIPIVIILLPSLISQFGIVGGAYSWLIYNMFLCSMSFYFVGRRFEYLKTVNRELLSSIVLVVFVVVMVFYLVKLSLGEDTNIYTVIGVELVSVVMVFFGGIFYFKKILVAFK
nr:oligosaccharide flippase family protein [Pseudomonas petroselini]